MYEQLERRIDENERSRLLAWFPRRQSFLREWGFPLLFETAIVSIVGAICLLFMEPVVVLLGLAAYFVVYWLLQINAKVIEPWRKHLAANKRAAAYSKAVETAETVRIQHVESTEVVEVPHDEGTIYLFKVSEDRTYWIDPERPCTKWPNSEFEVIEVPGWDDEIGPFCSGQQLRACESLDFREFDFERLSVGRLIDSPLDTLLQESAMACRRK